MMTIEELPPAAYNDNMGDILVVDDSRDIINVIQLALEEQPVQVYAANNGQEALQKIQHHSYDLLLLDAKMPGLSGLEVCRRVKNHEQWRNTKIIMISAGTSADEKLRAFDAGADDYVTKPFRVQELKARIQVMLNLRQAERELTQRNEQLVELIQVSELLNSHLNLDDTAQAVVKSAARLTRADRSYLLLWDESAHGHRIVAAENHYNKEVTVFRTILEDEGISALVRRSGKLEIIPNYQTWNERVPNNTQGLYETAAVPLRSRNRHIGTILVSLADPNRHFVPANLDILTTLANQAAIAIENARLYTDLSRENERYRLIAEKASDLIISLDSNGLLTYVNERVKTVLGYDPADMLYKPLVRFLTTDGQSTFHVIFRDLLQSRPEIGIDGHPQELLAVSKEGVPINLEFNFGLLYQSGSQHQVVGIQAIGRDVTARKRSEESERMRMIGQIASGVAHDLNNVLANVMGHAQLLKTETEDPVVLDTVNIIEQSARDGAETVRRIQEFTVQRMQQDLDLLDLNTVVQSTIDLSRPRWRDDAQQRGMRVEVERELQPIPMVQGKAAELREVLVNLLNNAIDAMPPQGGKLTFRTYLEQAGQMVCLEVADTGKGMPAEVRRHIFEPFYTTKGVRGTGLGLSVAYSIITRFGGEISVESRPNIGTTFFIRLPVATEPKIKLAPPAERVPYRHVHYKGRILAIDDEANLRNVLKRALSMVGFEVDVAASGPEALELLHAASQQPERGQRPYDLIFSDLGMPEMSGWEIAQEVGKHWPEITLVLVTGWGEQVDPKKMAEYNIQHTIAKPFNIQDLIHLAGQMIDQSKTGD